MKGTWPPERTGEPEPARISTGGPVLAGIANAAEAACRTCSTCGWVKWPQPMKPHCWNPSSQFFRVHLTKPTTDGCLEGWKPEAEEHGNG